VAEWLRANALTILTATVAVYGAVLSTLNYRHARTEKARKLKVRLSGGFLTFGPGMGTSLSNYQCLIDVSNPGHTPVIVRSVCLSDGKLTVIVPAENSEARRLPHELQPGQGCNFWIEAKDVAEGLAERGLSGTIKLWAVVRDGTGGEFQSDRIDFNVDDLRREG
jgi:hypothetical protein